MVFVFGSFILESDRTVKLMGAGLASAILLDATIVRLLLVPATMELLGDRNWWLPRWLDRILPDIDVEGHAEPLPEMAVAGANGDGSGRTADSDEARRCRSPPAAENGRLRTADAGPVGLESYRPGIADRR